MRLDEAIRLRHRDIRSVSIERDLLSAVPLAGYAPPEEGLRALRRITDGLASDVATRAWSITGPYGAGKSSFAHLLTGLLGPSGSAPNTEAIGTIAVADRALLDEIVAVRTARGAEPHGFVRAVATARREPVTATVTRALARGVREYWAGRKGRAPALVHDAERLAMAKRVEPAQLRGLIDQVLERAPLLLILDELGKCLEYAGDSDAEGDLFLLQELAERLSGEQKDRGAIIGIQHLAFEDYLTGVSGLRRQEWRKVQGRFEDIPFTGRGDQALRVTEATLDSSALPATTRKLIRANAAEAVRELKAQDIDVRAVGKKGFENSYPLHPVALLALGDLSARFGQHDRSLVAFLVADGPGSLAEFLREQTVGPALPYLGVDRLYDYFIAGAHTADAPGGLGGRLREIQGRVSEAEGLEPGDLRLLKVIAVLNLVAAGGVLGASAELLRFAMRWPEAGPDIENALDRLRDRGLITYREFAGEHRIWQGSDFDIAGAIANERDRLTSGTGVAGLDLDLVAAVRPPRPLVAARHSQQSGTLRYFEARYAADLAQALASPPAPDADGLLLWVFGRATPQQAPRVLADGRPVVVVATSKIKEITEAAVDAAASAGALKRSPALETDVVARREMRFRASQAAAVLAERLENAFDPAAGARVWAGGKSRKLNHRRQLSALLSELCDATYTGTPRVRNEMLNRRELTSQGARARRELITAMVERPAVPSLGFATWGPERAMYEAVLGATGVHRPSEPGHFGPPSKSSGLKSAWSAFEDFYASCTGEPQPLNILYDKLASPPLGMKEGPIPVLLTASLLHHADDLLLYQDGSFQPRLGAEVIERLVKTPDRFSVKKLAVDGVTGTVFAELRKALLTGTGAGATPSRSRNSSTLTLVRPLIDVVRTLPEFSLKTRALSPEALSVRNALLNTREPDDLLLRSLPTALGLGELGHGSDGEVAARYARLLRAALVELQEAYPRLLMGIDERLRQALRVPPHSILREDLRSRARHFIDNVIDRSMRAFLKTAVDEVLEDSDWVEAIATVLVGTPPRAWRDDHLVELEGAISEKAGWFRRLELLYVRMAEPISSGAEVRRITLTDQHGSETSAIAWIDEATRKHVTSGLDAILTEMEHLSPHARTAMLALLTERLLREAAAPAEAELELRRATA